MWSGVSPKDDTVRFDPRGTGANDWQPYSIPKGAVRLLIIAVGGGGGGGNGFGAAAAAARGGGGGGGSGGVSKTLMPVGFLPPVLFIQPGIGGAPVGAGGTTRVSVNRGTNAAETILTATGGGAGGTGTGSAAGTAGGASAIATTGNTMYSGLAI